MQGKTVTQGWDVLCAIAYDKINEWFLEQYVGRLMGGEDAVINGSVSQAGGTSSIQAVDLTLGPPLIRFDTTFPPDTVGLTINFFSGQVNVIQTNGTVLSTQVITPGDDYALTGLVPLASVQGEVENHHDVVIGVANGSSFAANLDMPEGAQTLLGQFIKTWLVDNLQGYMYKLGTLDYSDNQTNLTPAGTFQFATQIDATDTTDTGRLLLFIATTYNPRGGSQTSLGLADIVPQGCSTALIISSQAFFAGILQSFYESLTGFGIQAQANQAGLDSTYLLTLTVGAVNVGPQQYELGGAFGGSVWCGTLPDNQPAVNIPLSGTQLQASSNHLGIEARLQWSQDVARNVGGPHAPPARDGQATMTATIACQTTTSVTAVQDIIKFSGTPSINVSLAVPDNLNGNSQDAWTDLAGQIVPVATQNLQDFLRV